MKFSEIPFTPAYPAEVYEQAKQWLVKNQPQFNNTANYAIFNTAGQVESRIGQVCHRAISASSLEDRCLVVSELGCRRRNGPKVPFTGGPAVDWDLSWSDAEPFLRWWLYESYMGRFILNRDDIEFIKEYGIIVSADIPAPLLQNIMIVSRHFWEIFPNSFKLFAEFVSKGCEPMVAYMVCFNTSYSLGNANIDSLVVSLSNHRASPMLNLSGMKLACADEVGTWFGKKFNKPLEHSSLMYRICTQYSGGTAFFQDTKDQPPAYYDGGAYQHFVYQLCRDEEFRSALKTYRHSKNNVEMYRPPNPFKPKTVGEAMPTSPDQVSYKELFEFVVPYVTENPYVFKSQEEIKNAA